MTLENRANVRRFDHDEARARHAAGEKISALAAEYGVSYSAVYYVVTPGVLAANIDKRRQRAMTSCHVCGGAAWGKKRSNPDGRILCRSCWDKERRENVIVGAFDIVASVRCITCGEWKDPDEFRRGRRYRDLREGGFDRRCRPCDNAVRRARKEPDA